MPDTSKIERRMRDSSSLSIHQINDFLKLIKTDADEDAVFDIFTGWSNEQEKIKMYQKIDAQVIEWIKQGQID